MKKKHIIGIIIIALAFGYLLLTSLESSFMFSMTPSEFLKNPSSYTERSIKLSGTIKEGSISKNDSTYNFKITDGTNILSIEYEGTAPNTFRDNAEVIIDGSWDIKNKTFKATNLLTKCASKYYGE